jgi:hypothetical protein
VTAPEEPAAGPTLTTLQGLTKGKRVAVYSMSRWCPGTVSSVQRKQVRVLLDGAGKVTLAIRSPRDLRLLDGETLLTTPLPEMPTVRLKVDDATFDPATGALTFEQGGVRYVLPWQQQTVLMGKITDGMMAREKGAEPL